MRHFKNILASAYVTDLVAFALLTASIAAILGIALLMAPKVQEAMLYQSIPRSVRSL